MNIEQFTNAIAFLWDVQRMNIQVFLKISWPFWEEISANRL